MNGLVKKACTKIPGFRKILDILLDLCKQYENVVLPKYGINITKTVENRADWLSKTIRANLVETGLLGRATPPKRFVRLKEGLRYFTELQPEFFSMPKETIYTIDVSSRAKEIRGCLEEVEDIMGKAFFVYEPEEYPEQLGVEFSKEALIGHDIVTQRFVEKKGMEKFVERASFYRNYEMQGSLIYRYLILLYDTKSRRYYVVDILEVRTIWIHKFRRNRYDKVFYKVVAFYPIKT